MSAAPTLACDIAYGGYLILFPVMLAGNLGFYLAKAFPDSQVAAIADPVTSFELFILPYIYPVVLIASLVAWRERPLLVLAIVTIVLFPPLAMLLLIPLFPFFPAAGAFMALLWFNPQRKNTWIVLAFLMGALLLAVPALELV